MAWRPRRSPWIVATSACRDSTHNPSASAQQATRPDTGRRERVELQSIALPTTQSRGRRPDEFSRFRDLSWLPLLMLISGEADISFFLQVFPLEASLLLVRDPGPASRLPSKSADHLPPSPNGPDRLRTWRGGMRSSVCFLAQDPRRRIIASPKLVVELAHLSQQGIHPARLHGSLLGLGRADMIAINCNRQAWLTSTSGVPRPGAKAQMRQSTSGRTF